MTLTKLLEIDESKIVREQQRSLLLAEKVWYEAGQPRERWELVRVLEEILLRCVASHIWYAPILLQRKKAIERDSWRPKTRSGPPPIVTHMRPITFAPPQTGLASADAQSSVPAQELAPKTGTKFHLRSGTPDSSTFAKFLAPAAVAEASSEKSASGACATPALPLWTGAMDTPKRDCPTCHGTGLRVHPDGFRGVCFDCDAWETSMPTDLGFPDEGENA